MTESISFDRAAEYYDRTRSLRPETQRVVIELLSRELAGRRACLEIGVGTGRIALSLAEAGRKVAGADVSLPMLQKLVGNAGGSVRSRSSRQTLPLSRSPMAPSGPVWPATFCT